MFVFLLQSNGCSVYSIYEQVFGLKEVVMRELLRAGSSRGMEIAGVTFVQKVVAGGLACGLSALIVLLSYIQ